MKKLFPIFFALVFVLVGCNADGINCAYIYNKTQGESTNYAINVILDNDSRVEEKYVDLQIKCSDAEQTINFGEELQGKSALYFEKADEWYNLTVLVANAGGVAGYEKYEKYTDKGNKNYLFTSSNNTTLYFRVVVGNLTENDAGTGQILTSTEVVSNELKVDVKKMES